MRKELGTNPEKRFRGSDWSGALQQFFVLAATVVLVFLFINFQSVSEFFGNVLGAVAPVLTGVLIAYLLNPLVVFLEKQLLSLRIKQSAPIKSRKVARPVSTVTVVLVTIGLISLLGILIVPEFVTGITGVFEDLPQQVADLSERANRYLESNNRISQVIGVLIEKLMEILSKWIEEDMLSQANLWIGYLATGLFSVFTVLYNVIVGFIVSVYVLIGKERFLLQLKKVLYALVKQRRADWLLSRAKAANKTFSSAILGKILDSIIIGVLCAIGMALMGMPYVSLVSVIVGVTNVIPFVGPFIGAIPSIILILLTDPIRAFYFAIFILVLQQFDCNFLDPKIVGGSIGLPEFWEIFACLLGGGLFGLFGMLIGVPTFAVFYALAKELIEERLRRRYSDEFLETLGVEPQSSEQDAEIRTPDVKNL